MSNGNSAVWNAARPFLVGGTAGCMATACIQPIDMVKVRIQMGAGTNPVVVAKDIIAAEGIGGLYKGLSAGFLRQLTYGMSRLGIFRTLTNNLTPEGRTAADLPAMTKFGCSLTAGGLGALIGTPADAALIRMQGDSTLPKEQRRNYKNGLDAMMRMAKEEGMAGFFAGAFPTIVRGLAMNVGMFMTFDSLKKTIGPSMPGGENGQANRFLCGFLSGWCAASAALPFDYIKTQLQKQTPDANGKLPFSGIMDCAGKTIAAEGPLALYKGYPTFVVRISPHIMLTWVFMDNINDFLKTKGM
eukprot:TRINITY_DN55720_c0_g1_i1.p2 TRINITY_DN55720_c0_g1~~TRINITY_DN55720_c0_g1_i1.p2  ORF type:complete len:300 (+),score=77.52 TRINITY_DN55720_c0_g1_i1:234-1133(+)